MEFLDIAGSLYFVALFLYIIYKTALAIRIVPAKEAYIVERLGKYTRTLEAGFHLLLPFLDRTVARLSLKEEAIDVPSQICITWDNVQVDVDGVVYMKVIDPAKAAYNVSDYRYALIQLAQTTMRSLFGHLELDKTFEEREALNAKIVGVVDAAAEPWGIKILRYEIQNISPPSTVIEAIERQMTAERDKRATIARSEGEMQSMINRSEGMKQEMVNYSEGQKQKMINEAAGKAKEIRALGEATARGIRAVSSSLTGPGGMKAMKLSLAQEYLDSLSRLAREETSLVLPMDLSKLNETLSGILNTGNSGERSRKDSD